MYRSNPQNNLSREVSKTFLFNNVYQSTDLRSKGNISEGFLRVAAEFVYNITAFKVSGSTLLGRWAVYEISTTDYFITSLNLYRGVGLTCLRLTCIINLTDDLYFCFS